MVCFFWRSLECELCKVPYPAVVKIIDPSSSDDEQNSEDQSTTRYRRMSDFKANYGKWSAAEIYHSSVLQQEKHHHYHRLTPGP